MDDKAVDKLIDELGEDAIGHMHGKKLSRKLRLDEVSAIAERLQRECDKGVELRARAVTQNGDVIACKAGCNGCCEEPIMVFRPEVARIWRWLQLPENKDVKQAFLAAYKPWRARVGDLHERLSAVYDEGQERYTDVHIEVWRHRILCPFNRDGLCSIYPVRPLTCRNGHALNTSEHCHGGAQQPASRADFVPLEDFLERSRALLRATHGAMRGTVARPESMPEQVYLMLQGTR